MSIRAYPYVLSGQFCNLLIINNGLARKNESATRYPKRNHGLDMLSSAYAQSYPQIVLITPIGSFGIAQPIKGVKGVFKFE